jgi:hypothetical protein
VKGHTPLTIMVGRVRTPEDLPLIVRLFFISSLRRAQPLHP